MSLPPFLLFTPVPLKARHDGWSPELQQRFILLLAKGAGPGEAARRVGKNRATAYALRRKPGAESFAAAWDAALLYAKRRRLAASSPPARGGHPTPAGSGVTRRDAAASAALRAHHRRGGAETKSPERRAFDALLDRLYPSTAKADESGKSDKAGAKPWQV